MHTARIWSKVGKIFFSVWQAVSPKSLCLPDWAIAITWLAVFHKCSYDSQVLNQWIIARRELHGVLATLRLQQQR